MSETAPAMVKAFCEVTVKAVNDDAREVLHLITNARPDRVGDVVRAEGAEVTDFMRNPVVMANHDYKIENIIGRAVALEVTKEGIYARTQFRDTPLAKEAYQLAKEGLGGWSIGFQPLQYDSIKDEKGRTRGFDFKRWSLHEYSLVAIPMNPDVVQGLVQRGLITEANTEQFFTAPAEVEPSTEASHETKAEPEAAKQYHPAMVAMLDMEVSRVQRTLARARAAERIRNALRVNNG